jgi:hypothetical protein
VHNRSICVQWPWRRAATRSVNIRWYGGFRRRARLACRRRGVTGPAGLRWVSVELLGPGTGPASRLRPGREVPDDHCRNVGLSWRGMRYSNSGGDSGAHLEPSLSLRRPGGIRGAGQFHDACQLWDQLYLFELTAIGLIVTLCNLATLGIYEGECSVVLFCES